MTLSHSTFPNTDPHSRAGGTAKGSILFINRVFPPDAGASGLRLLELCQGLAEKNWRVTVLTTRGRDLELQHLHRNIDVVRIPFGKEGVKPSFTGGLFLLLALFLRAVFMPARDVTVTLTDPPMAGLVSAFLSLFKKTRTIHWVHDLYPDLFFAMGSRLKSLQPVLSRIAVWALRRHDTVVAIGDDTVGLLIHQIGDPKKVVMIPNWPDVTSALIDKKKPARHTSENPFLLDGVFTVLYSGSFGPVQEFDPIIDAIKIVSQSPHAIRFILAGDGPKFPKVRDRIESMMLSNVHFIRAQPKEKFMDMLLAGDVHIATMIPESVGLVAPSKINSALGIGRPCVLLGSPKAYQAELIRKHKAGVVVDMNDPHARFLLAEAIISYATNPSLYEEAQANALRAAESISFDRSLNAFDALFTAGVEKDSKQQ